MRPFILSLFLLASVALAPPVGATWTPIDSRNVAAMDMYDAHRGLLAFAGPTHTLMLIQDSVFTGIWAAPDKINGVVIQDSSIAWATIIGQGLFRGDKNWTNWTNTSTVTNQTLVAAIPSRVFLTSTVAPFFSWTIDGVSFTATTGIPTASTIVAMDYLSNEIVFAVSHSSTYRSTDGGTSWALSLGGLTGAASVFADRVHHIVYAGGDQLRMSIDSGKTWTVVYAPPELSSFHELDGQVFGAHDCSGTFYISNGYDHGSSILRSETQAQTFQDCDPFPMGLGTINRGWTFDRGSIAYWWDLSGGCDVSRNGVTGLITDSVNLALEVSADSVSDTLCSTSAQPFNVYVTSDICSGIRIDSISVVQAAGMINPQFTPMTLFGNSTTMTLSYAPRTAGLDSAVLRVWFHSLEWGVKEHKDIAMIANVLTRPAVLQIVKSLSFGVVHVDSAKSMTLLITNAGCSPMRVDSILTSNPALFATASPQLPAMVKRDSSLKIKVTYTPHSVGDDIESIEVGTSAGHTFIELDGTGAKEVSSVVTTGAREDVSVYPNPALSMLYVHASAGVESFELFDLLGRNVLHVAEQQPEDGCDVSGLANGFYTMRMGGSGQCLRVLIQH